MLSSLWNRREQVPKDGMPIDRQEAPVSKARIGLALGGGVARGWAHIGVLRTLLANDIVPDVIAGTSIGALVGGAWAARRLDVLEDWSRGITKRRMLSLLDVTIRGSGLIGGARLRSLMQENFGDLAIEELDTRFAAIATELGTGHEIWLTQGRLIDAIRASYSLPGIFGPVLIGGRWLVDGALVNPIPVSAARALGARVVIAVNVNADMFGRGTVIQAAADIAREPDPANSVPAESDTEPSRIVRLFRMQHNIRHDVLSAGRGPGLMSVMVDAFNITQDRIARSRLAGDPPDVLISPRLGALGLFEFHRADEAIRLGADAAERALVDIRETIAALS